MKERMKNKIKVPTIAFFITGIQRSLEMVQDKRNFLIFATFLWTIELVLNYLIINYVKYTNIDWNAYMEEVDYYLRKNVTDYSQMKGDTGPLVYPGMFVWIYSVLYKITDAGANVRLAQYIFMGLYQVFLALVYYIYYKGQAPPWLLIFVTFSHRIHSIFVLRLFNDPIAMLLMYLAVAFWINQRWTIGLFFYSLGVGVKMNLLLFAPGIGILLLKTFGIFGTLPRLMFCGVIQIVIGGPFLLDYPVEYMRGAFNFGRVFLYKETVNWKFLAPEFFVSKEFAIMLLALHLGFVLFFAHKKWCAQEGGIQHILSWRGRIGFLCRTEHILTVLFTSNFIGITFSRSLHYQFYVWFFHQVAYLLLISDLRTIFAVPLLVFLEYLWHIYPSNMWSSLGVVGVNVTVLLLLLFKPLPQAYEKREDFEKREKTD